ncbi:MAG: hypothetical protein JNM38_12610 [Acidobacteria bacterium]|nr:hypothetical protein [Acidobacteriota bacterium]
MRAAPVVVVLWAFLAGLAAPAGAAPTWTRIDSPNFIVVSDAGDRTARGVAWQFEQVRAVLQRLWPWARLDTGRPILVYAVKGDAGVRSLAPGYWEKKGDIRPASIFLSAPDRHYVVVRTDVDLRQQEVNPYRSAYWSYVGIVLDATFGRRLPPWLSRGLAEVMSNTIVRTDDLTVGQIVPWNLERLQRSRMTFAQLTTATGESDYLATALGMQLFDASAWALVHYLMLGERGANLPRFNKAATEILRGADVQAAVAGAFGGLASVTVGYDRYASQPSFMYQRIDADVDVKREAFTGVVMGAGDAAAMRALYLARSRRPVEAMALLAEARAAAPDLGLAFEVEGILADDAGTPDEARAAYARASELGGAGFFAEYRLAWLLWPGPADPDRAAVFARVVTILERSIAANPSYAWSRSLLARALLQIDRVADAAPHAQRAVVLAPAEASMRLTAARVMWAQDRRSDAKLEAERALALAKTDGERSEVQEFLAFVGRSAGAPGPKQE